MSGIKKSIFRTACAVILAGCIGFAVAPSLADMTILPLRVIFKDGERMKGLTVLNSGSVQAIYRLELQHKKQLPNGAYVSLDQPLNAPYDPSQWLVYSPRQVDLPPQGKQGIRMSLRRPADMPDGEYRVHAALTRIARDKIEMSGEDAPGAAAAMMINVGFAVPVVIRKGKYDTTAAIESIQPASHDFKGKAPTTAVEVKVKRSGKYSAMGRIEAYWTPPGGEEVRVNGNANMIIYPELQERTSKVVLDRLVQGGTLRLVYRGIEADKGVVFDEKTFPVQ